VKLVLLAALSRLAVAADSFQPLPTASSMQAQQVGEQLVPLYCLLFKGLVLVRLVLEDNGLFYVVCCVI
jgi:hypothetical protein